MDTAPNSGFTMAFLAAADPGSASEPLFSLYLMIGTERQSAVMP